MREYLSCQTALVNILNYCILAKNKHELAGYSCLQYVIVLVHLDISLHTLHCIIVTMPLPTGLRHLIMGNSIPRGRQSTTGFCPRSIYFLISNNDFTSVR